MGSDITYSAGSKQYSFPPRLYSHGGSPKDSRVRAFHTTNEWRKYIETIKGSNQLMVINFTASWCVPCKFIEPAVMALAAKFMDVIFVKIDVDELMSVSQEFGVEAMPTFLLLKHGIEVDKIVGAKKDELEKKIEKNRGNL